VNATGRRIGRYPIEGLIGTGGFATVYRARDERLDDVVAIKVLAENHSLDPQMRERFITITNVGDGPEFSPFASFTRGTGYDVSGAAILDLQGGFRYEVLEDSGGNCLCSVIPIPTRLASGGSATYYARFGAPPEGTSEVDFELPGFPPVAVPL
jgi:serine/threonine protein kinase